MKPNIERIRSIHHYLEELFAPQDLLLTEAQSYADLAGLKGIQVPPLVGKILRMLVQLSGAQRILEIGTLGGISAIWLARAMGPEGRLLSLEIDPKHAAIAAHNLKQNDLADRVEVRTGNGADILPQLMGPYDLFFFDADREQYLHYLTQALRLGDPTPSSLLTMSSATEK